MTSPGPHSKPLICPSKRLRQITPRYTDARWDNVLERNDPKPDPVGVCACESPSFRTLFTRRACKPGRNIGPEKWNAERRRAQWLIRVSVTPPSDVETWGTGNCANILLFALPPSFPSFCPSFLFAFASFPPSFHFSPQLDMFPKWERGDFLGCFLHVSFPGCPHRELGPPDTPGFLRVTSKCPTYYAGLCSDMLKRKGPYKSL